MAKPLRVIGTIAGAVAVTLAVPGLGAAIGLGVATASQPTRRDNVKVRKIA